MRSLIVMMFILIFSFVTVCLAEDAGFVDNSDAMVRQMLGGKKRYGLTRSFVVKQVPTRGIRIRARNKQGEEVTVDVEVAVAEEKNAARLKVEFDVNSAVLRPSAYPLLAELGKALGDERVAGSTVCIKGHTDSDGEADYNLKLSFDRARAVLGYIQGVIGLDADRIRIFGYGESMPLVANDSRQHKQSNRRVEVSLNCPEME
ncbi:OmpA family protein [Desulfomarina sp.]